MKVPAGAEWIKDPKNKETMSKLMGQWVAAGKTGLIAHSEEEQKVMDKITEVVNSKAEDITDIAVVHLQEPSV